MNTDLMFSSNNGKWTTPQDFFNKLDHVFKFDVDVCATAGDEKCPKFFTPEEDGLMQEWIGCCWMNPPYGRGIKLWIEKAVKSVRDNGATVVALVPARTDTIWWQEYCLCEEVFFVKGRLKFGNSENSAPFPSAVVVFRPRVENAFR